MARLGALPTVLQAYRFPVATSTASLTTPNEPAPRVLPSMYCAWSTHQSACPMQQNACPHKQHACHHNLFFEVARKAQHRHNLLCAMKQMLQLGAFLFSELRLLQCKLTWTQLRPGVQREHSLVCGVGGIIGCIGDHPVTCCIARLHCRIAPGLARA